MKKILKRIALFLLLAFIIIQFFRPTKNLAANMSPDDITNHYYSSKNVQQILTTSCYDCHSNNTRYPWYAEIQPIAWWLDDHVKEGKSKMNFSAFKSYSLRKQYHKLEEVIHEVDEKEMPLESYTYIHRDAKLSPPQRTAIMEWAQSILDTLKSRHPMDSLISKKK